MTSPTNSVRLNAATELAEQRRLNNSPVEPISDEEQLLTTSPNNFLAIQAALDALEVNSVPSHNQKAGG